MKIVSLFVVVAFGGACLVSFGEDTPGGKAAVSEKDRQFWSFQSLKKPSVPEVQSDSWSRNEIDRFVLAKLRTKGITPNPQASARELIRRAYFDLTGLPPSPAEVEEFVSSKDPEAYPKLIDRLLANPHYGERWGRHWLDVARFAESHGFEHDYDRPYAYHYRDFVIQALNADMPYNQFVKWQLAGDEFAPQEPLALMATGFLGAGVFPTQITANEVERTRYDALDDMSATTGTAMLGLTIGCARCHDHKFDPIPTGDYYRILSSFTTTVRTEVELDLNPKVYQEAKARFDSAHKPLADALADFERKELPGRFENWLKSMPTAGNDAIWVIADAASIQTANGTEFKIQPDGSFLASGKNPDSETFTVKITTRQNGIRAIRVEALADDSLPKKGPGRAENGNFALSKIKLSIAPECGPEQGGEIELIDPVATFQQNNDSLSVRASLDGNRQTGWAVDGQIGKNHAAIYYTREPIGFDCGTILTLTLDFGVNVKHAIGRPRIALSSQDGSVPFDSRATSQSLKQAFARLKENSVTEIDRAILLGYFKSQDSDWVQLKQKVDEHLKSEPKPNLTKVQICSEGPKIKPMRHHTQGADFFNETYFLNRGDPTLKQGVASQSFLQVLMRAPEKEKRWQISPPEGSTTSYRRRALANWITDPTFGAGALAARVIVNRLWQHHFSRGLVSTPNDFGTQGQWPSNPELLEWLANDLVENGWRLKRMHKLIMTSAAYMQNSQVNRTSEMFDPQNELCGRRVPQRLEGEILRDAMLAVSGVLDRTMFGPGTLDPNHKRRSIYFTVKRSQLVSMMQLFDAPEPLVSVGQRPVTTIAPQSLMFINSPQIREYASALAKRLPAHEDQFQAGVDLAYQLTLGRRATPTEAADSIAFLKAQTQSYREGGREHAPMLALTDFCQALLSLNEFIYID